MSTGNRATASAGLWAVVPAAGLGLRMGTPTPKQYLVVRGKTVLQHAVDAMLRQRNLVGVIVVLDANDTHWQTLPMQRDERVHTVTGGARRCESVTAGLRRVIELADDEVWVLVHDAARPLVAQHDVDQLITQVENSEAVGGLLAVPVQDTLKRGNEHGESTQTVSREQLWQAQTPQMFRAGVLLRALDHAMQNPELTITDEASAIELANGRPLLVEATSPNLKVTRPGDLRIADALLGRQGSD